MFNHTNCVTVASTSSLGNAKDEIILFKVRFRCMDLT